MAQIIWTEPALSDLDAIADYIALDEPQAARHLVQQVFQHVQQLEKHPESDSRPPEMRRSRYRQIVEVPCRVFYRHDGTRLFILYVMRDEMRFCRHSLLNAIKAAKMLNMWHNHRWPAVEASIGMSRDYRG